MPNAVHVTLYAGGRLLGRAEVRSLDAGMGVYGGPLQPAPAFESFRPILDRLTRTMRAWPVAGDALAAAYAARDALGLTAEVERGRSLDVVAVHVEEEGEGYVLHLLGWSQEEAAHYLGASAA